MRIQEMVIVPLYASRDVVVVYGDGMIEPFQSVKMRSRRCGLEGAGWKHLDDHASYHTMH